MTSDIASVSLPDGERIPQLGQGTWEMGEAPTRRAAEIAALRCGIELGMTLIDTAEMYGDGATEQLLGEALAGLRDQVFLVSKVYPHNASRRGVIAACEQSLKRLKTDRLDLYLLHWRGSVPLAETVEGFEALRRAGKIRHWGVSNFDTDDMEELIATPGGDACATNQILYNVALAWVLREPGVFAIPKAGRVEHVRDNHRASQLRLGTDELAAIDAYFKPPRSKRALEML